jgi:outer membrane protein assembly factor BamB
MRKRLVMLSAVIFLSIIGLYATNARFRGNTDETLQWREQRQDAMVIPQGGYVSLQADGSDAFSLREAALSTNETGSWNNETANALLWTQPSVYGFDNFGTATYENGVLYAPSKGDNNVYAVDASDGHVIWNHTVRQCDASPCIDGDVIYVGECEYPYGTPPVPFPEAMALDKHTGGEIWHFVEPNDYVWVGSPVVSGDYIYYTTDGGNSGLGGVYALNKTNGIPIWNQTLGRIVCSIAYDENMIFVSVYDPPGQYALNATTGAQVWHQSYGMSWDSSPIVYEGMVIQVVFNPVTSVWTTCVMNETNGELVRKFDDKGGCSTPLVHDGKVFVPNRAFMDWRMYAYNLSTGEELWHTALLHDGVRQNQTYCSPVAAGGAIYYQALNGTFYVINETVGDILRSYSLDGAGFGSPSIGDGRVFITNDAALYAFEIGPGSGSWPMFCQNNFHTTFSTRGIEYLRWPLTQPQYLGDISNTWVTAKFVWCNKTITSAAIAWKIYFFDGNGDANVTDTKVFYVNVPLHDVAVINVVPSATAIEQNQTAPINVIVSNLGNYTETFNVTLYCDSAGVGLQSLTLSGSDSRILTFEWNTTGISCADHTLKAVADTVSGETDVQDNTYVLNYPVAVVPEFSLVTIVLAAFVASTLITTALIRKESRRRK